MVHFVVIHKDNYMLQAPLRIVIVRVVQIATDILRAYKKLIWHFSTTQLHYSGTVQLTIRCSIRMMQLRLSVLLCLQSARKRIIKLLLTLENE